jgi:hypothetical protein
MSTKSSIVEAADMVCRATSGSHYACSFSFLASDPVLVGKLVMPSTLLETLALD